MKQIETGDIASQEEISYGRSNKRDCLHIFYPIGGEVLNQLSIVLGMAQPCTEVSIHVDGRPAAQTWADTGGHWQVTVHLMLAEGEHSLEVVSGCCKERAAFVIGSGAAAVPSPIITWPGTVLEEQSPVVQGKARYGDTVRVYMDNEVCGAVTVEESGGFSWQYPGMLEEGIHIVTATAIDPDGRESCTSYEIFRYQAPQDFSVILDSAQEGNEFRTVGLNLTVTGTVYPVTLSYLLLPPGSPVPAADEVLHYTGPGLGEGTAASGSILISRSGKQTIDISGLENAPSGALGLVDGYRYDVYVVADNGTERSAVLGAANVRAMPFAGGKGTEDEPYRIRELGKEEIAQKYPDLSAGRSPLGIDDTAHLLRNIEQMGVLFRESGGFRGVRSSMGLHYHLSTSLNLTGYAAAGAGQGWIALGYKDEDTIPTAFTGSLTGEGQKTPILGLTILRDTVNSYEGLFAYALFAFFQDLELKNASIVLDSSQHLLYDIVWIGTLAARMEGGLLENIIVSGAHLSLTSTDDINPKTGGLVGGAYGPVSANGLTGENLRISSTTSYEWNNGNTGGIFGTLNYDSVVEGSPTVHDATVSGSMVKGNESVGGFAGRIEGVRVLGGITVQDSAIIGHYGIGGVVGNIAYYEESREGLLEGISSRGNTITARYSDAGGVAAYMYAKRLDVRDSEASGCTVRCGENHYGGFLGRVIIEGAASFSRCSVSDCRMTGTNANFDVAGFAGTINNGIWSEPRFLSCTVRNTEMDVDSGYNIGGFVGYLSGDNGGSFEQCLVDGGIIRNTSYHSGGFAGMIFLSGSTELAFKSCTARLMDGLDCDNEGGGFIGMLDAYNDNSVYLDDCICQADVHCRDSYAGGFIGRANKGIFTRCRAFGAVSATRYAGGFIGESQGFDSISGYDLQFIQCAFNGTVQQPARTDGGYVGGFGGSLYQTMLKECYAAGDVRAFPDHCGGLAGEFLGHSLAEDCYFKGTLTSDGRNTGGIVGYIRNAGSTVNRCCCQAAVSGRMNTGGIGGLCGLGSGNIMEYSLVLAPSISGLTPTRRVMGDMSTALTLRENYSTTTQLLEDQMPKPVEDDPDGQDGGTITSDQIITVMRNGGWPDTIWDYNSVQEGNGLKLLNNPEIGQCEL